MKQKHAQSKKQVEHINDNIVRKAKTKHTKWTFARTKSAYAIIKKRRK